MLSVATFVLFTSILIPGAPAIPEETPVFEQPLLITSAGQNAEVQIAAVLAKRAGLDFRLSKLAGPGDLEGAKTLVLVLGASLKGLGAAGLDIDREKARVSELVAEARKRGIPLLCLHLGGATRRGPQTDELMAEILPLARLAVVVKSGNADGFFTEICRAKNIPLVEVDKSSEAVEPLKSAFGVKPPQSQL